VRPHARPWSQRRCGVVDHTARAGVAREEDQRPSSRDRAVYKRRAVRVNPGPAQRQIGRQLMKKVEAIIKPFKLDEV